jgi:hypothetical protein
LDQNLALARFCIVGKGTEGRDPVIVIIFKLTKKLEIPKEIEFITSTIQHAGASQIGITGHILVHSITSPHQQVDSFLPKVTWET